jgi:hypothetical protein
VTWCARPREEFRALVEQAIAGESWVVDGNYSKVHDLDWKRATHIGDKVLARLWHFISSTSFVGNGKFKNWKPTCQPNASGGR